MLSNTVTVLDVLITAEMEFKFTVCEIVTFLISDCMLQYVALQYFIPYDNKTTKRSKKCNIKCIITFASSVNFNVLF